MERGIVTIQTIKEIAEPYNANIKAVATHAIRNSNNFENFIAKVEKETGLKVEIIDGTEEARLCFLGMLNGLDIGHQKTLGIDLGGGSTEIILADKGEIRYLTSLNIGTVLTASSFITGKGSPRKASKKLKDYLISKLFHIGIDTRKFDFSIAVASSGTAKALASMDYLLKNGKEPEKINGYRLTISGMRSLEQALMKLWSPDKISAFFKLDQRRSEIIFAGLLIYISLSELFNVSEWTISTSGFREGVALDWYCQHSSLTSTNFQDYRSKSIYIFAAKYKVNQRSADNTSTLTLQIFNKLSTILSHFLPEDREIKQIREIVKAASFLHEVGKFINTQGYHKHSYYLLSHGSLLGYSQEERHLIALMIRFSRKKPASSSKSHKKPYLAENLPLINLASSCLRLAKVFSRKQPMSLKNIEFSQPSTRLLVTLSYTNSNCLEIESQLLAREIQHLEAALGVEIEFLQK